VTPPGPRARYRVPVLTSILLSLAPSLLPQDAPVVDAVESERCGILGPVLGDLRPGSARIWLRSGDGAAVEWSLSTGDEVVDQGTLAISDERDRTAVLSLEGLRPFTDYRATLKIGPGEERTVAFKTLKRHDDAESVRIAFGSCASHDRFESQPIWTAIARTSPRALVLLGDTPYIDSTDLARQRKRYREFWSIPELRPLAASVPVYSTWDDHDFATNDQVGAQPGRENSRRVFIEYHAQPSFGDGELGIDTSFRSGPVEVFLIDTRWYGDEERWPEGDADDNDADGELTSLLGKRQREALIASVIASTADVKVLSCGMVWNGAVRPGKRDHWGTWAHERDASSATSPRRSTSATSRSNWSRPRSRTSPSPPRRRRILAWCGTCRRRRWPSFSRWSEGRPRLGSSRASSGRTAMRCTCTRWHPRTSGTERIGTGRRATGRSRVRACGARSRAAGRTSPRSRRASAR